MRWSRRTVWWPAAWRQWEEALSEERRLKVEHEHFLAEQPAALTAAERAAIGRLANDIPALWRAQTTTQEARQAIVRLMLERIEVTVEGESEKVAVVCHWTGGYETHAALIRPVTRLEQLSYYPRCGVPGEPWICQMGCCGAGVVMDARH